MSFSEQDGVLHGRTRNAGILQEWIEVPWTWVSERSLESVRLYSRGLGHVVRAIFCVEPLGNRASRVSIYFGWIPRGFWQRVILRIGMGGLRKSSNACLGRLPLTPLTRRVLLSSLRRRRRSRRKLGHDWLHSKPD